LWNSTNGWEFNQPIKVTGNAVVTGDLDVQGADITNSTGSLVLTSASNSAIKLQPNGTGNVFLDATTVQIGESAGAQLTTPLVSVIGVPPLVNDNLQVVVEKLVLTT